MGKERCSTKEDGGEMRCIKMKEAREKSICAPPPSSVSSIVPPNRLLVRVFKRRDRVQYPNLFPAGDAAKRKSGFNEIFFVRMGAMGWAHLKS